jgi:hypothetical protein
MSPPAIYQGDAIANDGDTISVVSGHCEAMPTNRRFPPPWSHPAARGHPCGNYATWMRHDGGAWSNDSFRECKAVRVILPLIGAIALAGCVSQQEQQQKNTTAQLDTWIGQSISTVVGAHGPPQATFDFGPNKKMFQWVITPQSPGLVAPISGMPVTSGSKDAGMQDITDGDYFQDSFDIG